MVDSIKSSVILCLIVRACYCVFLCLHGVNRSPHLTLSLLAAVKSCVYFMRNDRSSHNPFPLDKKATRFLGVSEWLTAKHTLATHTKTTTHVFVS